MPYGKLLYKEMLINNINVMQLSEKLGKNHSYISKILKGSVTPPKEKLNNEIAKILNTDVRKLNIESYFDKAPQEMKDVIYSFTKAELAFINSIFNKMLQGRKEFDIEEMMDKIKEAPLSELLVSIIDNKNVIIENSNKLGEEIIFKDFDKNGFSAIMKVGELYSLKVSDAGYSPKIPENSRVRLEYKEKYNNGDIVALSRENGVIIRKIMSKGEYYFLTPENTDFELIQIAKEDAKTKIVGKVIEYIIKV